MSATKTGEGFPHEWFYNNFFLVMSKLLFYIEERDLSKKDSSVTTARVWVRIIRYDINCSSCSVFLFFVRYPRITQGFLECFYRIVWNIRIEMKRYVACKDVV